MQRWLSRVGVWVMRFMSVWPLPLLRMAGVVLGWLLWLLVLPRRRVVRTNLGLCFPDQPVWQRRRWERQHFRYFAQAWLDRSWLWHGSQAVLHQRLRLSGQVQALGAEGQARVLFAPHFVGLDAAWTALTLLHPRTWATLYTPQADPVLDAWVLSGRQRHGRVRVLRRDDGLRPVAAVLREGGALYLLPDMNFGPSESIFVPFFGVAAATVPSLPRFARLGQAVVVPVIARLTDQGYDIEVGSPWPDYPGPDVAADTALMNRRLEDYVQTQPAQYYWVHKRFKTRPAGEAPVY